MHNLSNAQPGEGFVNQYQSFSLGRLLLIFLQLLGDKAVANNLNHGSLRVPPQCHPPGK